VTFDNFDKINISGEVIRENRALCDKFLKFCMVTGVAFGTKSGCQNCQIPAQLHFLC